MGSAKTTRGRKRLVEGIGHVGYEVWMTAETAAMLAGAPGGPVDPRLGVVYNALLESALIHTRALADFFIRPPGSYGDDMRRTDFAEEWDPSPSEDVAQIEGALTPINKYLAHLTWRRVQKQQWEIVGATRAIVRIADAWSKHLSAHDAELHAHFRPSVANAFKAIEGLAPDITNNTGSPTVVTQVRFARPRPRSGGDR
ncbi:MAG TPA: hypothetical protein VH561_16825 [Micromonosporaceae bacterium]|jgi:hypothetical protein